MKSVLISIQPKWCELIASGKKTVEVRKTRPHLETPFKCYIYETKGACDTPTFIDEDGHISCRGRGQVIGEFVCDRIYEAIPDYEPYLKKFFNYDFWDENGFLIDDCLSDEQKDNYAHGKPLYGWHISDLKIYDKPKELGEFYPYQEVVSGTCKEKGCNKSDLKCYACLGVKPLTRSPQSWCYVEEL